VTRLIRAELLKVRSTRLWLGLLSGGLVLDAVGVIAVLALAGTEQGARAQIRPVTGVEDVRSLVWSGGVLSIFVVVLAATMATAEYRYGTAASTYLAAPARWRVLASKLSAAIPIGFAFGLTGGLLPIVITFAWFAAKAGAMPFGMPVVVAVGEVGVQCAYAAALAVCVGVAVRSQLVAILGLLGWALVVEPLAFSLVHSLKKWAPFAGAQGAFGAPDPLLFGRPAAAGLMLAYVATAWYVAYWLERRRDV
jgi:hypothetical protein